MKQLKPRDKVTQHMTRDGLTLDNQTTGESVNVSSREAEQEYTAQPEGAAEKILERADELHDRHKAKKAAKDAGKTVAQATGPVSRLQFTAEERASPELAPYIKKAEKRADKLEAAKEKLAQQKPQKPPGLPRRAGGLAGKPVALMTKDDKVKAIRYLSNSGALLITKSGDKIAKHFGISKYTLYSYLDNSKTGGTNEL